MHQMNLLDRTYQLLKKTELTFPEIADGAGVGIDWLKKFKGRFIESPGVNRVQRVHDFLSSSRAQRRNGHA